MPLLHQMLKPSWGPSRALVVGLLFSGFLISQAAAQEMMSASAIQKQLGGKRVSLSCIDGTTGNGRYVMARNFGTITGTYQRPGIPAAQDVGQVRSEGDQLCLKFRLLNDGNEKCFRVRQESASRFSFIALGGLVRACTVSSI